MWLKSIISWLYVKRITLSNVDGLQPISGKALWPKTEVFLTRFCLKTAESTPAWVSSLPGHPVDFRLVTYHSHPSQFPKINLFFFFSCSVLRTLTDPQSPIHRPLEIPLSELIFPTLNLLPPQAQRVWDLLHNPLRVSSIINETSFKGLHHVGT